MIQEIWKPVVNFEGLYEVSSYGNIRTLARKITDAKKTYIRKAQNLKATKGSRGYYRIKLYNGNGFKDTSIHKEVALAFIPNPENKPYINHINGVKTDNRVENLEWCTHSENVKHAYAGGLKKQSSYCGEGNSSAKLIVEQVIAIREEYKQGNTSYNELARKYGVKPNTIGYIITKKTWKYVAI